MKKKKPYRKPTLSVYGTLAAITRAVGANGSDDAMSGLKTTL